MRRICVFTNLSAPDEPLTPAAPVFASEVAKSATKSPEELERERTRDAVRGRITKRTALKAVGADVAPSSSDLAATLEHGVKGRTDRQMAEFRKRQAVRKAVHDRLTQGGGDAA